MLLAADNSRRRFTRRPAQRLSRRLIYSERNHEILKMQYDTAILDGVERRDDAVTPRGRHRRRSGGAAPNFSDYINPNNPVSHSNSGRRGLHRFPRSSPCSSLYPSCSQSPFLLRAFSVFARPPRRGLSVWHTNSRDACVVSRIHTMTHFSTWIPKLKSSR